MDNAYLGIMTVFLSRLPPAEQSPKRLDVYVFSNFYFFEESSWKFIHSNQCYLTSD